MLAGLAFSTVLLLLAGDAPADKAGAANIQPPTAAASTNVGQISAPAAASVNASQVSAAPSPGPQSAASAPSQLSPIVRSVEPSPALSSASQGRTAVVTVVSGHDRCDSADPSAARRAECAAILDRRAEQFTNAGAVAPVTTADPDAPASSLVNDIVNSGTGSVVVAPAPR